MTSEPLAPSDYTIELFKKFLYLRHREQAAESLHCPHETPQPFKGCECCNHRNDLQADRSMIEIDAYGLMRREGYVDLRDEQTPVLSEAWWEKRGIPFKDDGNYDFLAYGLLDPNKSNWMPGEDLPENFVVDFCGKQYRTIYDLPAESNIFFPPSACAWELHDPARPTHRYQQAGMAVMEKLSSSQKPQKAIDGGVRKIGNSDPQTLII